MTRAGYYAWVGRARSTWAAQDRRLLARIQRIFTTHRGRYGSPRIHEELQARNVPTSRRRVARLMRTHGLHARAARIYRGNPKLHQFYGQHPNRVRGLHERRRDRVWVGDITYVPVAKRWYYLAVIMDRYSRRILAWRLARRRTAQLTRAVLEAALARRRPRPGLIVHSDRGSEYAGHVFADRVRTARARQSAAQRGPAENAHMESFFHSLKAEGIHGRRFPTLAGLRTYLRRYIYYYNHRRRHSALAYQSPVDYEARSA